MRSVLLFGGGGSGVVLEVIEVTDALSVPEVVEKVLLAWSRGQLQHGEGNWGREREGWREGRGGGGWRESVRERV